MVASLLSLLFLAIATVSNAEHQQRVNHDSLARRIASNSTLTNLKRGGGNKFSWYDAGLGACGGTNTASDFIVALSAQNWDGGSHCYKEITIQYNGRSAQAQIVDECMGCPYDGLDFSRGLFNYFVSPDTPENVGIIYGSWDYGSGGGGGGGSGGGSGNSGDSGDSQPVKKTTTTKQPEPTTTKHTTTSTTTHAVATTVKALVKSSSVSSTASPTKTSASVSVSASVSASASASATATVNTQAADVNKAFVDLAQLVVALKA
ncbi:hypothetical protein C8J56DRAFT_849037 [Mycena floridula]|nr:hypothetical protein C8J56DRAFT_849037 [Mycena floridula]